MIEEISNINIFLQKLIHQIGNTKQLHYTGDTMHIHYISSSLTIIYFSHINFHKFKLCNFPMHHIYFAREIPNIYITKHIHNMGDTKHVH